MSIYGPIFHQCLSARFQRKPTVSKGELESNNDEWIIMFHSIV